MTFDGVSTDRMNEMKQEMESGQPPEGLEPKELLVLHDPDSEKSLVVVFFEDEDAYRRGDEVLSSMPTDDTPGQRTSVSKFNVALRQTM
ncbi:MAG: hypothetical protein ACXVRE_06375 [Gaiellaceae bacterium]